MNKLLKQLESFFAGKVELGKTFLTLIQLEARLAKLSIVPLVIYLCLIFILLTSTWLAANLVIGYGLHLLFKNYLYVFLSILAIQIGFLLLVVKGVSNTIRNMSFEKTREFLAHKQEHHEPTQSIDYTNTTNSA